MTLFTSGGKCPNEYYLIPVYHICGFWRKAGEGQEGANSPFEGQVSGLLTIQRVGNAGSWVVDGDEGEADCP